nr:MAG TPA: hypothetical protein [Bacteriophage sp.]
METYKEAEFAKNSENKENPAEFTAAVREAGLQQGSIIYSKLYNTMLGELTKFGRSLSDELENVLAEANITPTDASTIQILTAIKQIIRANTNGLQLGDLIPNTGINPPAGRFLCNGQWINNCQAMFPDFYNYVIKNTPYVTNAVYNAQVNIYGQCGFIAVDGASVRLPLITRPISGVSNVSQCGQAINDTMRPISGLFTAIDRGDRGRYSAPFKVAGRWSTDIKGGGGDQWGTYVQMDTATLGTPYNGSETRGKQIQYPYYIQVYTAPMQQSLVDVQALIELLKYQNQLGIQALPAAQGNISLVSGGIYRGTISGDTTFVLPAVTDNTLLNQILIQLTIDGAYSINWGTTLCFSSAPSTGAGSYNIIYEYDALMGGWVVGQIEKLEL